MESARTTAQNSPRRSSLLRAFLIELSHFEMFKTFDEQEATDNRKLSVTKLPMPVLTIEDRKSTGGALEIQTKNRRMTSLQSS